jgi:hypothetical protein
LFIVFGFVQWRQKRTILWFGLAFLFTDALQSLLVMLSAGSSGMLDRESVIWFIRALVIIKHSILGVTLFPFLAENTTIGRRKE